MENKTEMGLLLIIFGMVLSIFSTIGSLASQGFEGSSLSPGIVIPIILTIFGLILMFAGLVLMLIGRKEFGGQHAQFVIYALVTLIIGVIIVIIGSVIITIATIAGGLGTIEPDTGPDYATMARAIVSGLIFSEVGGVVLTIGAILLVYSLENEIGRRILILALVASIIISIVTMIFVSSALEELAQRLEDTPEEEQEEEFNEGVAEIGVINGLDVIGMLILLIGFIIPYNRIKKGELKPMAPPPQPYGMPQYPPAYPYQPYPPYQQPYQPPPYQPPPPPYQPPPRQPPQQPESYPGEVKLKSGEDMAPPEPSSAPVQPKAVTPEEIRIKMCMFCGKEIPLQATICPVCKRELKSR